jgi:hypothetical protein
MGTKSRSNCNADEECAERPRAESTRGDITRNQETSRKKAPHVAAIGPDIEYKIDCYGAIDNK